jgi:hypothetical protein
MSIKIISSKDAKAAGLKRYFTGVACKYGHVAERLVSTRECIGCSLKRRVEYRGMNPDRQMAYMSAYYEANRDGRREENAAYRAKNKDRLLAKNAAYYEANRDKCRAQQAAYHEANRNKINARAKAGRAAKRSAKVTP